MVKRLKHLVKERFGQSWFFFKDMLVNQASDTSSFEFREDFEIIVVCTLMPYEFYDVRLVLLVDASQDRSLLGFLTCETRVSMLTSFFS